jgi:hypothetical protein
MESSLYEKIAEVVQEDYPGSLVTHWSAVVTIVTDEGTEVILTLDRPEQPLWQSMGLLDFVREMRRGVITSQISEHDERDERDD